ncbi:MAG TPA: hypothetical protein VKF62_08470, partial [Planctomycetota bacterium]|nr:hypothetical protein [Planctomycetota bacterium]
LLRASAVTAWVEVPCPSCRRPVRAETASVACPSCGTRLDLATSSIPPGGALASCRSCGCPDLYRQKDFPRKVGLAIVGAAALLVFVAVASRLPFWAIYVPLLGAAALDAALYLALPEVVVCYRCRAKHRGYATEPRPAPFDPAVHDRYAFGRPGE